MADQEGRLNTDALVVGKQIGMDISKTGVVLHEPDFELRGADNNSEAYIESNDRSPTVSAYKPSKIPQFKGVLRHFNPVGIKTPRDFLAAIAKNIPINDYGLPAYIIRADMLDVNWIVDNINIALNISSPTPAQVEGMQDVEAHLDSASVPLDYSQGYPTLPNEQAMWKQLDYEPAEQYQMFLHYLGQDGIREISRIDKFEPTVVSEAAVLYYWSYRSRAYDMYRVVHHSRQKIQRALSIENKHFEMAEKLMAKLGKYFENMELTDGGNGDDDIDPNITPEKAVGMMEKLVKIQRISAGLPAMGESKENQLLRPNLTPVDGMQQLVRDKVRVDDDTEDALEMLGDDPDDIVAAQELVIRMQLSSKKRQE